MTEASDYIAQKPIGDARIIAHPRPELSQILERFMDTEYLRTLGGSALYLVSEQKLDVYEQPLPNRTEFHRPDITPYELSLLKHRLKERQNSIKPRISPHVLIGSLQSAEGESGNGGIDLRFRLVLDELTAQVLNKTVFTQARDPHVYVHYRVQRDHMRLGLGLNDTRDELLDLLRHSQQTVESIRIDSNA